MPDDLSAELMKSTVGGIAAIDVHACALFDRIGLDLLHDGQTVVGACRARNIDTDLVAAELAALELSFPDLAGARVEWWELDIICTQVVHCHHGPLRSTVDDLRGHLATMVDRWGTESPELASAQSRLTALVEQLRVHFSKEENILFPAFAALAEARRHQVPVPPLPFPSVLYPIRVMEADHRGLDEHLKWLGEFVQRFEPPAAACAAWAEVADTLARFARELSAHAQFESHLLFRRALELERTLA